MLPWSLQNSSHEMLPRPRRFEIAIFKYAIVLAKILCGRTNDLWIRPANFIQGVCSGNHGEPAPIAFHRARHSRAQVAEGKAFGKSGANHDQFC